MEFYKRKRYCYILTTRFSSAPNKFETEKVIQNVPYEKVFNADSKNLESLGDEIHTTLDSFQFQNGPHDYLLDVLWFTDSVPKSKNLPPSLFGALKRAIEWNGAAIFILNSNPIPNLNKSKYLKELKAELINNSTDNGTTAVHLKEYLDPNLYWRGSLAFFDDSLMTFINTEANFELRDDSAATSDLNHSSAMQPRCVQFSQRLKIVSKCSMSTIPSYFFTKTHFILRTTSLRNETLEEEKIDLNKYCLVWSPLSGCIRPVPAPGSGPTFLHIETHTCSSPVKVHLKRPVNLETMQCQP